MLSRPLMLNESDDRGRGLSAGTPPPALPLADEGDDEDDSTQTGVFSPPAPPWSSSSSSSPSSPPPPHPPHWASSFSSAASVTPPPSFLSSSPPPPPSVSSTPFSPLVPSPPYLSSPPLPVAPSFLFSRPPPPPRVSPPPPHVSPPPLSSHSSSTPLMSLLTAPLPSFSPPTSSHFAPLSFSSPPAPPSALSSPPSLLPPHSALPPPLPPLLFHHSSPLVSPRPPPSSVLTPPTSSPFPPLSSSSSPPLLSLPPSSALRPPPPSCSCSSLLPRLLSAHRMEVRRLLRGALASLGRRLDSLERRNRRKRRRKSRRRGGEEEAACSAAPLAPPPLSGLVALPCSSTSSCSPAPLPPVTSSSSSLSSSDSEESTALLASSFSQSEQRRGRRSRGEEEEEGRGRKRRRKNHGGRVGAFSVFPVNTEEEEEEEHAGRFVGQMAVSFRGGGAEEEATLTLYNINHRKHRRREEGDTGQSEKAISVVIQQNGYRAVQVLHSISSSSSHHALHLLQRGHTFSQSDVFSVSSSQWRFSDFTPPFSLSSNFTAFRLSLSSSSFSPAPMLRLSAVAMETLASVRGGACGSPLRPLKDWTASPSLSSDHCYVRSPTPSPTFSTRRQQKQRANHSARSLRLPRRRSLPLPPCPANGLSVSVTAGQSAVGSKYLSTNGERGKRVSQIRIRRASPRETPLTPMGLPKVKRLKKKEFSLEEIYTNKNYKSPTTNRSLETIFEEPREKDGALLLIGQQRRRRLLLFPDFTQPRKRKRPQGVGLPVAMVPKKRAAARRHYHGSAGDDEADLDVMLVERLSALEDFLTRQGLDV